MKANLKVIRQSSFPGQHNDLDLRPYELILRKMLEERKLAPKLLSGNILKEELRKLNLFVNFFQNIVDGKYQVEWVRPIQINETYNGGRVQEEISDFNVDLLLGNIDDVGQVNCPLLLIRNSNTGLLDPSAGRTRATASSKGIVEGRLPEDFVVPAFTDEWTQVVQEIADPDFVYKWMTTENQQAEEPHQEPSNEDTTESLKPMVRKMLLEQGLLESVKKSSGKGYLDYLRGENPDFVSDLMSLVRIHTLNPENILKKILGKIDEESGQIMNSTGTAAQKNYKKDFPNGIKRTAINSGSMLPKEIGRSITCKDPDKDWDVIHSARLSTPCVKKLVKDRKKPLEDFITVRNRFGCTWEKAVTFNSVAFAPSLRESSKYEGKPLQSELGRYIVMNREQIIEECKKIENGTFDWKTLHCSTSPYAVSTSRKKK